MIDKIFAMIMKEARSRKGKDLVGNVYTVFMEIGTRTLAALNHIRDEERSKKKDETKNHNT